MNDGTDSELLTFSLDSDGDRNESFEHCRKYITENFMIIPGVYYPGFFDSAYFHFSYKEIHFRLEYSGWFGTELICVLPLTDQQKEIAHAMALRLVEALKSS